jgi:hypothetical protein
VLTACADIHETYLRSGFGPAMAKFIAIASYQGPVPAEYADQHDFDALRAASTRIVIGVGEDSAQVVTGRASAAVARRLGAAPVTFPGGHDGFLGGEYGGMGKPDAFAATLRAVLDDV